MKFTVSCEVTYRRTWEGIEAETAEQAQALVFGDGCDIDHDEALIAGPGGPSDLEVEEERKCQYCGAAIAPEDVAWSINGSTQLECGDCHYKEDE